MEQIDKDTKYALMLRQCMWLADLPRWQFAPPAARDPQSEASGAHWSGTDSQSTCA